MRICKYVSYLLFFCCLFSACYAKDSAVMLEGLLTNFTTYTAHVTQRTVNSQGDPISSAEGEVKIKKPDYFFWETLTPTHQQLFGRKNTLWVYDVDLAQATERPVSAPGQMNPVDILVGDGKALSRYFIVKLLSSSASSSLTQFELTAKDPNASFLVIHLTFNHDRLVSIVSTNNLGQTTTFTFSKIVLNQSISDKVFLFNDKQRGIDIIKASQPQG